MDTSVRRRRTPLTVFLLVALISAMVALPAAADHVDPIFVEGNATCGAGTGGQPGLNVSPYELKVEPITTGTFTRIFNQGTDDEFTATVTITSVTGNVLDFADASPNVLGVVMKGGPNAHLYDYRPDGVTADTGLVAPQGFSHVSFCFDDPPPRTGAILLEKVGFGGGPLTAADGVEFTIYDADDNAIPMPETSTPGTFCAEDLDFGIYSISETGVPDNYLPLEDITGVEVDDDGDCDDPTVAFTGGDAIVNAAAPGDVIIEKVDGEGTPLAGATFNLSSTDTGYDEDCTTDASGTCSFTEVPAGLDYVLDETAIPAGYTMGAVTLNGDPVTLPHTFDITPDTDLEFLFVVVNDEIVVGEWCSPGFWRNNPLAVAETGVDMGQSYNALFDPDVSPSNKAVKDGATANPTLQQVLDSPQWYGGGAFNNVGDLLSAAHPDVDFTGERVEDSCPLAADASGIRG